MTLGRS